MSDEVKVPHDRAVVIKEITAYAKSKCKTCHGKGVVTYIVSSDGKSVRKSVPTIAKESMCGCALKHFAKAFHDNVVIEDDVLYWLKDAPKLEEPNEEH